MRLGSFLSRLPLIAGLGLLLYICLNSFSPYQADGSLNATALLIVFVILAALTFLIFQSIGLLFGRPRLANKLAFIGSFALVQVVLVSSGSFVSLSSLLVILLFNFFIFWYAIKVL